MLDRFIVGQADDLDLAIINHIDSCERCSLRLQRMRSAYQAFLDRYPDEAALGSRRPPEGEAAAQAATQRSRWQWGMGWSFAGALATAAIVMIAVFRTPAPEQNRPAQEGTPEAVTRIKGASIIEIAVKRAGQSLRYSEQPLQAGDLLAFRYTTKWKYLLLVSLEQTGKINVFFSDEPGKQSRRITPGNQVSINQGVELDHYAGPERLMALLSDRPLQIEHVRQEITSRFKTINRADKRELRIGKLPFRGEQLTWLLHKVR